MLENTVTTPSAFDNKYTILSALMSLEDYVKNLEGGKFESIQAYDRYITVDKHNSFGYVKPQRTLRIITDDYAISSWISEQSVKEFYKPFTFAGTHYTHIILYDDWIAFVTKDGYEKTAWSLGSWYGGDSRDLVFDTDLSSADIQYWAAIASVVDTYSNTMILDTQVLTEEKLKRLLTMLENTYFTATVQDITIRFKPGMTWREWKESDLSYGANAIDIYQGAVRINGNPIFPNATADTAIINDTAYI